MNPKAALLFSVFALITYHQNVRPILDGHCVECHAPGSDLDLSQFPFPCSNIADQKTIVDTILAKTSGNPAAMPPGHRPKLDADEIETIQQWQQQGLVP